MMYSVQRPKRLQAMQKMAKMAPKMPTKMEATMMNTSQAMISGCFRTVGQKSFMWKRQGKTKVVAVLVQADTKFRKSPKSGICAFSQQRGNRQEIQMIAAREREIRVGRERLQENKKECERR